jgi:hypothetical protein
LNQEQNRDVKELNSQQRTKDAVRSLLHQEPEVPLFLRDGSDGEKGNAQDEKDETAE